ncbi:MAG: STAS domain-containing protein [Lentisphaerota bacterium]
MSVECSKSTDGKIVCKFIGRMDTTKCTDAEREVMGAIDGAEKIVFDLDGVEYIASSFLRLCGKASHKVSAGKFSIVNVTPSVKKVFKIAGLAERLNLN